MRAETVNDQQTRQNGMEDGTMSSGEIPTGGGPVKLLNRNYVLLWQGKFVSRIGANTMSMAILLWIKEATGSASLMGLVAMLSTVPAILFGMIGGTIADTHSRRGIIVAADLLKAIVLLVLAYLFSFDGGNSTVLVSAVVVLIVVASVAESFSAPALSAAVPALVPTQKLTQANTLAQVSMQLSVFIGQGLGGVLFRVIGVTLISFLDSIANLWSAVSVFMTRIPQPALPHRSERVRLKERLAEFWRDNAEGFKYVWAVGGLRDLALASTVLNFFSSLVIILIPFYVEDMLQQPADWVGFLAASYGAGAMLGYILASMVKLQGGIRGVIVVICMILDSVLTGVLGVLTSTGMALGVVLTLGAMGGFVAVHIATIVQLSTPSQILGRVFGVLATLSGGLAPLGMAFGGVLFDWLGHDIPLMFLLCGGVMTAIISVLTLNRDLRGYLAKDVTLQSQTVPEPTA